MTENNIPKPTGGGFKAGGNLSTNTVLLSRRKMGMNALRKEEPADNFSARTPAAETPAAAPEPEVQENEVILENLQVAEKLSENMVWCPKCDASFEISSEFYGIAAECSECSAEFKIPDAPTIKNRIPAPPRRTTRTRARSRQKAGMSATNKLYIIIIVILIILIGIAVAQ